MRQRYLLSLFALFYVSSTAWGQHKSTTGDPAGYVLKYNAAFDGIGPKVYVLPAPRTKTEILTDTYAQIALFQDTIDRSIAFEKLLSSFVTFTADSTLVEIRRNLSGNTEEWLLTLQAYAPTPQQKSLLANDLAKYALIEKDTKKTLDLLQQAIRRTTPPAEISIRSSLADVLIFDQQYTAADSLIESNYAAALARKNTKEQAVSQLQKAELQFAEKNYTIAENTIIRQAIPLFNRAKDYPGKMEAWIQLAHIYLAQQKYTETQWFLIQAKDLATKQKMTSELAEINYLLGLSKYKQHNYLVAQKELNEALELATKDNNRLLTLSIMEKLGQIQLVQKNTAEAEKLLAAYWALHKELFDK